MTDLEERVRDALRARAEEFTASPDAWERTRARAGRRAIRRQAHRPARQRWLTRFAPLAAAAAVLTEPGHAGAGYDVTGPEALSYADVAAKLTTVLGRPISYVDAPDDAVRQALLGFGLSEWFADALVGLYQDYRRSGPDGYAAQVTDTVPRLTGRPARSLDDLLAES